MNFNQYLSNGFNKINLVNFKPGHYSSLSDFFDTIIKPNLPSKDTLKKWHSLLMSYVNDKNFHVYAIRNFGNYLNKNDLAGREFTLRRGFYTESTTYGYFFADNYFSKYFALMAKDNYVPDYNEFFDAMVTSHTMPFGARKTKIEDAKSLYKCKPIHATNYKLSHIFSANEDYYLNNTYWKKAIDICHKYFPRGNYNDWNLNSSNIYVRNINNESAEAINLLKAMFLRAVHPFNYFWTPKSSFQQSNIKYKRNDIGEYPQLINMVHDYYLSILPTEYKEFMNIICLDDLPKKLNDLFNSNDTIDINITNIAIATPTNNKNSSHTKSSNKVKTNQTNSIKNNPIYKSSDKAYDIIRNAIENNILTKDGIKYLLSDRSKKAFNTTNNVLSINQNISNNEYHTDSSELVDYENNKYAITRLAKDISQINKWEESLNVKVMQYAYAVIKSAVEFGKMSQAEFDKLTDKKESKSLFGINFPALVKEADPKPQYKYSQKHIIIYKGVKYQLTNDWFDRHRAKLIEYDLSQTYKIGVMMKQSIEYMFSNNLITDELFDNLCDKNYCHNITGQYRALIIEESIANGDTKLNNIYYKASIFYKGKSYRIWSQWKADLMHNAKIWIITNLK